MSPPKNNPGFVFTHLTFRIIIRIDIEIYHNIEIVSFRKAKPPRRERSLEDKSLGDRKTKSRREKSRK